MITVFVSKRCICCSHLEIKLLRLGSALGLGTHLDDTFAGVFVSLGALLAQGVECTVDDLVAGLLGLSDLEPLQIGQTSSLKVDKKQQFSGAQIEEINKSDWISEYKA